MSIVLPCHVGMMMIGQRWGILVQFTWTCRYNVSAYLNCTGCDGVNWVRREIVGSRYGGTVINASLHWSVLWLSTGTLCGLRINTWRRVILSNHPHTSGWSGTKQTALDHIGHSDTDHHSGRSSNQKSEPSTFTVQSILWPNVNDCRLSAILVTFLFKNMWNLEQWLADHWYGLVKTRT